MPQNVNPDLSARMVSTTTAQSVPRDSLGNKTTGVKLSELSSALLPPFHVMIQLEPCKV
jgi:hypothetical protein